MQAWQMKAIFSSNFFVYAIIHYEMETSIGVTMSMMLVIRMMNKSMM